MPNTIYYGDNLRVLPKYVKDESVDLIYLDPPFNSKAVYNVLYKSPVGSVADAQIRAFNDAWKWEAGAELAIDEVRKSSLDTFKILQALQAFLDQSDMMAYLVMMAVRLLELHRVLKDTGCLYLHCDPTASHYLKILLDAIFGPKRFRNDIVWKRVSTVKGNFGQGSKFFGPNTDDILFYSKSDKYTFNPVYSDYSEKYKDIFKFEEPDGRRYHLISMIGPGGAAKGNPFYEVMGISKYWRYSEKRMQELIDRGLVVQPSPGAVPHKKHYLADGQGVAIQSLWEGIEALSASSAERLGYPTQKPLALLRRIIEASSNKGDIVLDPFCGCGTTIHAAEQLERSWIGIDITFLAVQVIEDRLSTWLPKAEYRVEGIPHDEFTARALAKQDHYTFQQWAVGRVGGQPRPKGADRGIDGEIVFLKGIREPRPERILVFVTAQLASSFNEALALGLAIIIAFRRHA